MVTNILLKILKPIVELFMKSDKVQSVLASLLDRFKVGSPKLAYIVYATLIAIITVGQKAIDDNWIDGTNFWIIQGFQLISLIAACLFNAPTYSFKNNKISEIETNTVNTAVLDEIVKETIASIKTQAQSKDTNDNNLQQ